MRAARDPPPKKRRRKGWAGKGLEFNNDFFFKKVIWLGVLTTYIGDEEKGKEFMKSKMESSISPTDLYLFILPYLCP